MGTHLCEKNLGSLLRALFGEENVKSQVVFKTETIDQFTELPKKTKFVVDYTVNHSGNLYVVEFDGYHHFQSSKRQYRDFCLMDYCIDNEIILVQIPYFVQPDARLLEYLFGFEDCGYPFVFEDHLKGDHPRGFSDDVIRSTPDIDWDFPHGFVSKECLRPADFNIGGWRSFTWFYQHLMDGDIWSIAKKIYESLENDFGNFPTTWSPVGIGPMSPEDFRTHYPT